MLHWAPLSGLGCTITFTLWNCWTSFQTWKYKSFKIFDDSNKSFLTKYMFGERQKRRSEHPQNGRFLYCAMYSTERWKQTFKTAYGSVCCWPLTPKVGPWDGCRRQAKELSFRWADRAWTRPIVTVLLPSPSGVGVMLHRQKKGMRHYFIFTFVVGSNKLIYLHTFTSQWQLFHSS